MTGTGYHKVASSYQFNLAIDNNQELYAWGHNNYGQLGNGNTVDPTEIVVLGSLKWVTVHTDNLPKGYAFNPYQYQKSGYIFSGWYCDANYQTKLANNQIMSDSTRVLYAKWEFN
ncbi:hypothetical protein BN85412960 [Alteracholeplasma palmae J233]|uniref:Uncharacterized protein n=1 Tax=Alteracholeplasma palmae (strain ATCC 49389 / J233) TaxID=1318466 RepID=U4KLS6_ALTPJ|nr:InlB B-repeat-containing protein [Alteracholeplasma palmae]CCV64873.1 hypothetical protein BN85412960 [Alteracholeplasma palmae J233]